MEKEPTRRTWLAALMGGVALLLPGRMSPAAEIAQPAQATPEGFMDRAFALRDVAAAAGDQSYGAVVVRGGAIIGEAPSRVVVNGDPSAHAEMEAIRDAAARIGSRDLSGALLISSSRPCPMCEAAASYAGIARMIHGRDLADAGPPRISRC
jgi:tRNA(Arg) A34 adenosine deaminase TadA